LENTEGGGSVGERKTGYITVHQGGINSKKTAPFLPCSFSSKRKISAALKVLFSEMDPAEEYKYTAQ
jgi:hypothetical protein